MTKATDIRPIGAERYFLPVETRVPLKFGPETLTSVTLARARMRVADARGNEAEGWAKPPSPCSGRGPPASATRNVTPP